MRVRERESEREREEERKRRREGGKGKGEPDGSNVVSKCKSTLNTPTHTLGEEGSDSQPKKRCVNGGIQSECPSFLQVGKEDKMEARIDPWGGGGIVWEGV